jgi:hypothetical protein
MINKLSLNDLWESASSGGLTFQSDGLSKLPEAAQLYLEHAISPGTRLAQAVRLCMHGEIKLQRWLPFKAEQVIVWNRGFIWSATVRMYGIPIRGSDRLLDGEGAMNWRVLGVIPVLKAFGPDITRSAAGRMAGETIWLPSILCSNDVSLTSLGSSHLHARVTIREETSELDLVIDENGRLETVKLLRWGNPGDTEFDYVDFGAIVEEENTFNGYTIPTRLRVGWHFGTDRFESEGEFFRATIDTAEFR